MRAWIESLADDAEKRATTSVWVGASSTLLGLATYVFVLSYPVSVFLSFMGILLSYTSLHSKRGWHAILGMILSGFGLLSPLVILAASLLVLR
ncbi:MAG: hypothetical protein J7K85_07980 [Anaerolineaceae bacterium]|nr:hypothetical protein [Anaerolineaceae bacterium]